MSKDEKLERLKAIFKELLEADTPIDSTFLNMYTDMYVNDFFEGKIKIYYNPKEKTLYFISDHKFSPYVTEVIK